MEFERMLGIFVVLLGLTFGTLALGFLIHTFIQSARRERRAQRALDSYERILIERMDVIKTAVAVGFDREQLDELDTRLEKLIGSEKLQGLLDGRIPEAPLTRPLLDSELSRQVEQISARRQQRAAE